MATVGFLRFDDFLTEIAGAAAPVRVEAYHRSTPTDLAPLEIYRFYVEVAAEVSGDTLVFRFQTGQCQSMGKFDHDKVLARQQQAEAAAFAIHHALEEDGFDVRAGLIAAAAESKVAGEMPEFVWAALEKIKENGNG